MAVLTPEILAKIYKYCAFQERSRAEVRKKLTDLGVFASGLNDYVEHLEDEGFLNEARFLRSFVRGKFSQNQWGRFKIIQALRQKGIDTRQAEAALEEEIPEEKYAAMIRKLLHRKMGDLDPQKPSDERDKAIRYLMQKGFEWEQISRVIQSWEEDEEA